MDREQAPATQVTTTDASTDVDSSGASRFIAIDAPPAERANVDAVAAQGSPPSNGDGEWMMRKEAADALGVSRTTLGRLAKAGKVPSRVDDARGFRMFRVTAGAARVLVKERRRRDDAAVASEVAAMIVTGATALDLCKASGAAPKQVLALVSDFDALERKLREREAAQRQYESLHGDPCSPTTWAWAAARIGGGISYAAAQRDFSIWKADGGRDEDVSPLVARAGMSAQTWQLAATTWMAEVKARDNAAAEALFKMQGGYETIKRQTAETDREAAEIRRETRREMRRPMRAAKEHRKNA